MHRRGLLEGALALALLPLARGARAGARLRLGARPPAGARYRLELERRREVFDAGTWVVEATSRARARLEVRAVDAEGVRLRWHWTAFGAPAGDGPPTRPPDPIRARMERLWEGLAFELLLDPAGRLRGLADPAAARRAVIAAVDAALADVRRQLVAEGKDETEVAGALEPIRRQLLAPMGERRGLEAELLAVPRVLFALGGLELAEGELREAVAPGPLDFAPGREHPLRMRDRLVLYDPATGLARVERREEPAEPLDRILLLDRLPGLAAMWRRLPAERRPEVLAALPPAVYRRITRWQVPVNADGVPREVVRIERSGLGTLLRRLRLSLRVTRRDDEAAVTR